MNYKAAFRWAAFYRGLAWVFGIVGLLFVAGALALGFDDVVYAALNRNTRRLADPGFLLPPLLLALVGFAVWQLGKTLAFYKTLTEATESQMATRFDAEHVKSEILSVLDERLAEMQTQVEGTRRTVEEIDAGSAAAGFEFED